MTQMTLATYYDLDDANALDDLDDEADLDCLDDLDDGLR